MRRSTLSPEHFAKALLKFVDAQQPVSLTDVTEKIGLRIEHVNSTGFEGALIRVEDRPRGIIAVRESIRREKERERFTIAHEIGHYLLPGHDAANSVCQGDQVELASKDKDSFELAANRFAVELLLPSGAVRRIVRKFGISMDTCSFVGKQFQASLTAAAVQCVVLSDSNRAALVVSRRGVIEYFKKSPGFSDRIHDGELPSESLAKQLLIGGEIEKKGMVPARTWVDLPHDDFVITEHSIYMRRYERIITLLTP